MNSAFLLRSFVARLLGLSVLVLCGSLALAQEPDPPGRVGRLNHAEGTVTFSPAGDNEWIDVQHNRPLTRGDRLWTDRGSRAEIQIGSSALRLDGQTHLEILALDDRSSQLSLTQGTVYVRVRNLPDGENFEIDTPNLAYRAAYPGDYRIDVNATDGTTRVTIHSGAGVVYGEGGHSLPMGGGQQISFRARALSQVAAQESPPQDAFDRWASERNRREDQSISARHVPREVVGYQQLDAHGQWKREPVHGAVWYPQGTPANWAPYRHGHWEWIGPWGWTWIDDAPWGFAPFHYGRWAMIESRWAWVPGRLGPRPVYAPALVAFVGNKGGGLLTSAAGRSGVAWFPLAPGEMWQPAFRASVGYISNVNRHMVPGSSDATYVHQRRPEALTFISGEDFHRGRPTGASWWRIAADTLTSAGIVPPPPMPDRTAVAARDKKVPQRTAPAPQPEVRQVATGGETRPPGDSTSLNGSAAQATSNASKAAQDAEVAKAQQTRIEQAQAEKARVAEQAKASQQTKIEQAQAEKARVAEQAKAAQQAKLERAQAEKARLAEQARMAEQARLAEQLRRSEQAEQARQAALERSRAAQQAKVAAKAQLEQQRKVAEQARQDSRVQEAAARAEVARREQQARRTATGKRPTPVARTETPRRNSPQVAQRDRREAVATRAEPARHQQGAKRELQAKRAELARRQAAKREELLQAREARRAEQMRREAEAKRDEEHQRIAHAQRVEQARRIAERDAQVLREQRAQREEQARRLAEREYARREREYAEREAWQRQQQAIAEQWRREAWEQQQRERARSRQPDPREDYRGRPPEVWQRGIPILNPGRTS